MVRKSNTKEFREKVKKLVGNEYIVIDEYINSKTKIKILHGKCAFEYMVAPNDFLPGYRCPKCAKKMKK